MRFSVVIPTHQRRALAVRAVQALERQQYRDFEVIVVVDGSSDGTAAALRELRTGFPLTLIEQPQLGAAAARNAGAASAAGELLLFLDDDMEADPQMLAEHDRSHRDGAELVIGDIPLHPDSPPSPMAAVTGRWAERRRRRLSRPGCEVSPSDLISGQMSVSRRAFQKLGAFDVRFTRGGLVPGADVDFGHRARRAGLRIAFNPSAISHQYYDVGAGDYTRRSRAGAIADQGLSMRYPEIGEELTRRRTFGTRRTKLLFGALAHAPSAVSWPLRTIAVRWFERDGRPGSRSHRLFFSVQTMEYVRGLRLARRAQSTGRAVVLAYHAIRDLRGDVLSAYGVPPARLAAQLDWLRRSGWRFVALEDLLRALEGTGRLPRRAIMLTFDDAYTDLLESACPILAARGIPAVTFAVGELIGGCNDWRPGASRPLPLLDEAGLRQVASRGIAVGSHAATHRPLVAVGEDELYRELRGSAARLEAAGLPRPQVLAYPHGEWSPAVAAAVHSAGYAAAFTVTPGVVERGENRYALPRVEVYADDSRVTVWLKVLSAGWPHPLRRRILERLPGPGRRRRR